jgi:hypothetical protein
MVMVLEIKNCQECPFCNSDNEYGYDGCNLEDIFTEGRYEEMPNDKRHDDCPLNKNEYTIKGI